MASFLELRLNGAALAVGPGEVHAAFGPAARLRAGRVLFQRKAVSGPEAARRGFFRAFDEPPALAGVTTAGLVRAALAAAGREPRASELRARLRDRARLLGLGDAFPGRALGELTPAERRRAELLQLACLEPRAAVVEAFDEDAAFGRLIALAAPKDAAVLVLTRSEELIAGLAPAFRHDL